MLEGFSWLTARVSSPSPSFRLLLHFDIFLPPLSRFIFFFSSIFFPPLKLESFYADGQVDGKIHTKFQFKKLALSNKFALSIGFEACFDVVQKFQGFSQINIPSIPRVHSLN